jgi:hypothetical protein
MMLRMEMYAQNGHAIRNPPWHMCEGEKCNIHLTKIEIGNHIVLQQVSIKWLLSLYVPNNAI